MKRLHSEYKERMRQAEQVAIERIEERCGSNGEEAQRRREAILRMKQQQQIEGDLKVQQDVAELQRDVNRLFEEIQK